MKTARFLSTILTLAFAACLFAPGASAQQSILLTVDVTDPANVTIAATSGTALASSSNLAFSEGIDLINDFTSEDPSLMNVLFVSSNLTTYLDGAPSYNDYVPDNFGGPSDVDLNLYTNGSESGSMQHFTAGTQAFTGSIVFNLNGASPKLLPPVGTIGDIYVGYSGDVEGTEETESNSFKTDAAIPGLTLIGQYLVVPEAGPSTLLLAGGAALLAGRWLRRRFAV